MDAAAFDLPIVPHEHVAQVDCCGCLMVQTRGNQAEILCNECGAIIRTVAERDVLSAMLELARTDLICSATCTHCGAPHIFYRMSSMIAFTCRECGEGVDVAQPVQ